MGLDYALRRRGPLTMAPSQLGAVHALRSVAASAPISSFTSSRCRSTSSATRCTRSRPSPPASAICGRRSRGTSGCARADPADKPAIQPNYLVDRRGPARRGGFDPRRARRSSRSRRCSRISRSRYLPGAQVASDDEAALAKAAGDIGTTIFHPVGTAKMGAAERSDARWSTSGCGCIGHRGAARDRRLGDADDHLRQHQFADHDDRREGRGDGAGGSKALIARYCPRDRAPLNRNNAPLRSHGGGHGPRHSREGASARSESRMAA